MGWPDGLQSSSDETDGKSFGSGIARVNEPILHSAGERDRVHPRP
jgi:hypothetical protein